MSNFIRKYKEIPYEQKTVLQTIAGLCVSAVLACVKLVIGLFTDYNLCGFAAYTFAILLSKLECVLGIKTTRRSFERRNMLIAVFLFVSSVVYIIFMSRMFFTERRTREYSHGYVEALAFISFAELGFALAGLFRAKNKGHFYRDIKIINFGAALIAILTTQMTILDFTAAANTDFYNACSGIGVGAFIAACAVYIYFAPQISVVDRERNAFVLLDGRKNKLISTANFAVEIVLCPSRVYGSYVYRATVVGGRVDGKIERDKSLWNRMPVPLKILCCILSEILIFVWLIGRGIFFLRSVNLPARLETIMNANGFEKVSEDGIVQFSAKITI